jgi:hypothetical protein
VYQLGLAVGDAPCQMLVRRPTHRQGCPQQRQEQRAHNRKTVDETMSKIRGYRGRRASSSRLTGTAREQLGGEASGRQIERLVDELILLANMITADPPRLPLPDHVHRLVSLDRPSGSLLRYSPSFQPTSHPRQRCNTPHPVLFREKSLSDTLDRCRRRRGGGANHGNSRRTNPRHS